jgi:hypothetical protein
MSTQIVYTCKCCGFQYRVKLQTIFFQPEIDGWVLNVKGEWTCWYCQQPVDRPLEITVTPRARMLV